MTQLKVHRTLHRGSRQKTLLAEGWASLEVKKLLEGLKASGGSMTEPTFWAMRKSRVLWYNQRLMAGWTRGQIMAAVRKYYRDLGKYDVWKDYRAMYGGYPIERKPGDYATPHPLRTPGAYRAASKRRADRKIIDVTIKGEVIRF